MITRKEAEQIAIEKAGITKEEIKDLCQVITRYFGKKDLARQVLEIQPFYYDESRNWWYWNKIKVCWQLTDETNIMNMISMIADVNTVISKEKTEILEALRQESRLKKPEDIKRTWIQFQSEIIDVMTGDKFPASSKYFVTNPIPYKLNSENYEETPTIDKIFEEWVGLNYVKTLYEIIAYCLLPDYPIHRLFCFVGAGMNGKSKFLELLKKFIGELNCTSTELDTLLGSRFEMTKLHKKLVCLMGETNFAELERTSIIKKLTGGDLIGFEYKNKNPFDDRNYAKILIATNNLPTTNDKSIGFYRRWLIIDFPNQFSEMKDILNDIPEEEYEALALKSCIILKDLIKNRRFYNEGSIEERMKRFEDRSNPFDKFLKECCDTEDPNGYIFSFEFEKKFSQWLKQNRFREFSDQTISTKMREHGIEKGRKISTWLIDGQNKQLRCWYGVKWKE